jgi:hypothetical protein
MIDLNLLAIQCELKLIVNPGIATAAMWCKDLRMYFFVRMQLVL